MTPSLDARLLDALVDGALPEAERRALLLRLEAEPDGWRRCALAFLEAQAWREALGPLSAEITAPRPSASPRRRLGFGLARAAVLLAAIGLGWALSGVGRPALSGSPTDPTRPLVEVAPERQISPSASAPALASRSAPAISDHPATGNSRGPSERRGFTIERTSALVPIGTHKGRPLAVPVDAVKVRYVGRRTV